MAKPRNDSRRAPAKRLPSVADISIEANALEAMGNPAGAVQVYREWLAQTASADAWIVHFNVGVLLNRLGESQQAAAAYAAAIALNPGYIPSYINLGRVHESQRNYAEAIAEWTRALQLLDASATPDANLLRVTLNNLGRRLEMMGQIAAALAMYTRSLEVQPDQEIVLYHLIYLRQQQCAWPIYAPLPGISIEHMVAATSPLAMLAISDDPSLQLRAAIRHRPELPSADMPRLAPPSGYSHDRLRIGYLSSNFGIHPVSALTAELYELHDRSRVEVFGFCWSPEDNSDMRRRVRDAMDQFICIGQVSDEAAARMIRDAEIDILVDLQGQTAGARPNILAYRPAPVQIAYLGFPGTSGLAEIDYVLVDRYVACPEAVDSFSEKLLYLPDCFQVNDRKRSAAPALSRREYGLPEDAFVFCTFNKNTKFNPEFFSAWMRILTRTPNSVLWLLAADDAARKNLIRHAALHGIAAERLVFAPRVPMAQYLARFTVADLFLDISPFNGGTTVSDALWMGLPVLTCSGRLAANRDSHPLFDTPKFVGHLEDIFSRVALRPTRHDQAKTPNLIGAALVAEREIYFVVYAPAFQRTSGGVYALHALAEDMYAMGCNVGVLAAEGMPGARVPLISLQHLEDVRAAGLLIVAIYPEIVTGNSLNADYAVWWLLNYPGFLKDNWDGNHDWADRVVSFGPEVGKQCRCDAELIYPLYDPDFFFPNAAIPKTEITYYVHRIFNVAETIQAPVSPTFILNPANKLSYKQLRLALWKSKVVISHEWSGTLVIAQLCGVPVILMQSPALSADVQYGGASMPGAAWGYSEQSIALATRTLATVRRVHRERKDTWQRNLLAEIGLWVAGVKHKR